MKHTIRKKGEKYYKKFKPCGADLVVVVLVAITIIYTVFEVIRG